MLLEQVKRGQQGLNKALPIGIKDPKDALIGILPSHYYLIGADAGVGKTTFTDYNFVLTPYFNQPDDIDIQWFYYSLELGASMKKASWLNYVIWREEKKLIPIDDLLGFKGTILTEEQMFLIEKYTPVVEKLAADVRLHDDSINPTGIYHELLDFAEKNGNFTYEDYEIRGVKHKRRTSYIPDNPRQRVIVVIDHLALLSSEQNKSRKELMDLMSEYAIKLRNLCGFTFVIVQQFSTAQEAQSRSQNKNQMRITPGRSDFGDSTYTYRDAEVVIGGVCPAKFEFENYRGYDIKQFGESLTFWFVIKNRWIGKNTVYPLKRVRDLPILTEP